MVGAPLVSLISRNWLLAFVSAAGPSPLTDWGNSSPFVPCPPSHSPFAVLTQIPSRWKLLFYSLCAFLPAQPEQAHRRGRESTAGSRQKKNEIFPSPWPAVLSASAITEFLPLGTAPPLLKISGASPGHSLSLLLPHFCTGSGAFCDLHWAEHQLFGLKRDLTTTSDGTKVAGPCGWLELSSSFKWCWALLRPLLQLLSLTHLFHPTPQNRCGCKW